MAAHTGRDRTVRTGPAISPHSGYYFTMIQRNIQKRPNGPHHTLSPDGPWRGLRLRH
jgi:hypothetical protein